jgi:hypothetical protein
VGDAVGDDPRFAAARSGEDQQRALGGLDREALLGIQLAEQLTH